MILEDKIQLCKTCENSKHLLNMMSGNELQEALDIMINVNNEYEISNDVLKKNTSNGWLPIGTIGINNLSEGKTNEITNKISMSEVSNYFFIINENEELMSTGSNNHGQLGLGDTNDRNEFEVVPVTNIKKVMANDSAVVIIKNDGTVWTCGRNDYGQLGLGDTTDRSTFTQVSDVINVKEVYMEDRNTYLILDNEDIVVAGHNYTSTFATLNLI